MSTNIETVSDCSCDARGSLASACDVMHASYEPQRAALAVGLRVVEVPAVSVDAPLAVDFLPHDQRPANTDTRLQCAL